MVRQSLLIPTLTQGISQQPEAARQPGQLEGTENTLPSPVHGLMRRPPTNHIKTLIESVAGGANDWDVPGNDTWHFIDRGAGERYAAQLGHNTVRVWDLEGNEYGVYDQDNLGVGGAGVLSAGDAEFVYLDQRAPNVIDTDYWLCEQDGGSSWNAYVGGSFVADTASPPIPGLSPALLRKPTGQTLSGAFLTVTEGMGEWIAGRNRFGVYFQEPASGASNGVQLVLYDGSTAYVGKFLWSSGALTVDPDAGTALNGGMRSVILVDGLANSGDRPWYYAVYELDTPAGSIGSNFTAYIRIAGDAGSDLDIRLCAPRVTKGGAPNKGALNPASYVSALSLADYTIVGNKAVTVAQTATGASAAHTGDHFVFVKQGAYEADYEVDIDMAGESTASATLSTWDGNTDSGVRNRWDIHTLSSGTGGTWTVDMLGVTYSIPITAGWLPFQIAEALSVALRAHPAVHAEEWHDRCVVRGELPGMALAMANLVTTGGGGTLAEIQAEDSDQETSIKTTDIAAQLATDLATAVAGWAHPPTVTNTGSVIRIAPESTTYPVENVAAHDSTSGILLDAFSDEIASMPKLPTFCAHDHVVKIIGEQEAGDTEDDYYVKFEADFGSGFGEGRWVETIGPGLNTAWDGTTMPHQLISTQDDASGTVTGSPYQIYFTWGPVSWTARDAGDNDSNPFPGIDGKGISDVFFHRGRLGMVADQSVLMSEVNLYFQTFRTTVLTLVDSDPIDITADHPRVSLIHSTAPIGRELMLFSDKTQFVLSGKPLLTPASASIKSVLEYENSESVSPVALGTGVVMTFPNGGNVGVREIVPTGQEPGYTDNDLSILVPALLEGEPSVLAVSSTADTLVYSGSSDRHNLQVFSFTTDGGERVQSAWSTWSFGGDGTAVLAAEFIGSTLYLVIRRLNEVCLEKIDVTPGQTDDDSTYITHLDRRVTDEQCSAISYHAGNDETTFTIPFRINGATKVTTRDTPSATGGTELTVNTAAGLGHDVVVDGDYSSTPVWIGHPQSSWFTLSKPYVRVERRNGSIEVLEGRTMVYYLKLQCEDTAGFTVDIERDGYPDEQQVYDESGPPPDLGVFEYHVSCTCENDKLTITITNATPWPSTFLNGEWGVNHVRPG